MKLRTFAVGLPTIVAQEARWRVQAVDLQGHPIWYVYAPEGAWGPSVAWDLDLRRWVCRDPQMRRLPVDYDSYEDAMLEVEDLYR